MTYVFSAFFFQFAMVSIRATIFFATLGALLVLGIVLGYRFAGSSKKSRAAAMNKAELAHRNAQYSAIISSIADGLITTNADGGITFINESALNLLGITNLVELENTVGKPLHEVMQIVNTNNDPVDEKDLPVYEALRTQKRIDSTMSLGNFRVRRSDGTFFPIAYTASPIRLAGEVAGVALIFRDDTWQEEIDKAKNEFVNLASHQLRTPITTINWYVELLEQQLNEKEAAKVRNAIDKLKQGTDSIHQLVVELLDVSRLELGSLLLQPKAVSAKKIIDEVCASKKEEVSSSEVEIHHDVPNEDIEVSADPGFLKIILENLLSNAIKYSPKKSKIELKLSPVSADDDVDGVYIPADGAVIEVIDHGCGIPEKQQSKIFSKMFRADNVRSMNVQGTGLGLYMVRLMVNKMSGSVWFISDEGVGSTFKVYLTKYDSKKQSIRGAHNGK